MKILKTYNQLFERNGNYNRNNIKEGDIVNVENRCGLVISKKYSEPDYDFEGYDVYYRSLSGDIYFEEAEEIRYCYDLNFSDVNSYVNIAKRNDYLINIPIEFIDDFPEEYKEEETRKNMKNFNI